MAPLPPRGDAEHEAGTTDAQEAGSLSWIRVGTLHELRPGRVKCVSFEGRMVALFNVSGALYAIDDDCPHEEGGSLSRGSVEGDSVWCPPHGARFVLSTGQALEPPEGEPMGPPVDRGARAYPIRAVGDEIYLALE
jgi:3-phenylpropionate/trans-cinnamate dioxygenase ferredoxin subunit